jgi:hypothetical protein
MSELRFPATIDGLGRLKFDEPELVANELRKLAGKRVVVDVKRERLTRSIEQNRLLWSIHGEAVADSADWVVLATGQPVFENRDAVHGFAKANLLLKPTLTNRGEVNLLGSTTTLSTTEFSKYIELLCAKLAQYGVNIPEF